MSGYEFGFNLESNVSLKERIASVASGSFLIVNGLTGSKSIRQVFSGGFLLFRGITGHCHLYNLFMRKKELSDDGKLIVRTQVTVKKSKKEVYDLWRKLDTLPQIMNHIKSVNVIDKDLSIWHMKVLPIFLTIEWTSEVIKDKKYNLIEWESIPGSQIENTGTIEFNNVGDDETEIVVEIAYKAPGGKFGEGAAHLLNPILKNMIKNDIKSFKKFAELGEVTKKITVDNIIYS